jgi:tRNA A-37 threonylcarbamoyl transferase component Bud32
VGNERGLDEPVPGDILGNRYEILEEIGRGGMATVYKGRDLRLSRKVAVKVFRGGFADAVDPRRTTQEMQLLGGVNHPAIVSVLDASNGDERFGSYLVMELVVGDDLGALLKRARGPLSADFARRIVGDVASALQLLHEKGVVHRDVKPGNILVSAGAGQGLSGVTAKLTDFGIAQMVDGAALTASDSILGTAAYLSPEQVRGSRLRPASDVYSLGLVLLETLTGRRAFPGPAAEAAVARLTRPPALPIDASPALADLLSRMTALDPSARPRAEEVAAALRGDLAGAITAPDAEHTAEVPRAVLAGAGPVLAAAAMAAPAETSLAEASSAEEDATLPHPSLWTPAAGIPLGPRPIADTGARPLVVPPIEEPRRRFPTLLAVGASALAAAVAGVIITSSTGLWNPPNPAAAVNQAGAKDGVTANTPAPVATDGGQVTPLRAATGGDVVATTPHARSSPRASPSPSRPTPSPAPTTGSSSSPTPSAVPTSPSPSPDPSSTVPGSAPSPTTTPTSTSTPSGSSTPPAAPPSPAPTGTSGAGATASADPSQQTVLAAP